MPVIIFPELELYLTDATKKKILLSQLAMSSDGSAAGRLVYLFLITYGVSSICYGPLHTGKPLSLANRQGLSGLTGATAFLEDRQ